MEPGGNTQFFQDVTFLKECKKSYDSLGAVEANRKVGVNIDGTFFVSIGYNTHFWRIFQSLGRTISYYRGYKTTVIALLASLKKSYSDSDDCIRRIVTVVEQCMTVPVILENAIATLTAFEKTLKVARERLATIAETYEYEGDSDSALLINEENKLVGSLYKYARDNRKVFQRSLSGSEETEIESDSEEVATPSESEEKEAKSAHNPSPSSSSAFIGPQELTKMFERKIDELLALDARLRTKKTVQGNFEDLFQEKFTLEDISDIKKVRDNSPEELSKGSRIEEERQYWQELLRGGYREDLRADVKKDFQEAFAGALKEATGKVFTRFQKQVLSASRNGPNMLDQILQKVKEREERVAAKKDKSLSDS